jgi:hypothetical protein
MRVFAFLLLQTPTFVQHGHIELPHSLLTFLQSHFFKKVGINIGSNLKRLHRDCGFDESSPPFVGATELGAMAKERGAAVKRNVALADLVSTQLLLKFSSMD